MKIFKINKKIEIVCRSEKTRNGFRHLATLLINGSESQNGKCCYLNRTWERYEFQSVLYEVVNKAFKNKILSERDKKICDVFIKEGKQAIEEISNQFKTIGTMAQLGEIFCDNQKDKNDWKKRMLKAGLENKGLSMPDDWETLDEDTKQERLDKVIEQLKQPIGQGRE